VAVAADGAPTVEPVWASDVPDEGPVAPVPPGVSCEVGDVLELTAGVGAGVDVVGLGVGAGLDGVVGEVVPPCDGAEVSVVGGDVAGAELPPVLPVEPDVSDGDVGTAAGPPEPAVGVPVPLGAGMTPGWEPREVGGVSNSHGPRVSTNLSEEPGVAPLPLGDVRRVASPEVHGSSDPRAEERPLTYWSPGGTPRDVAVVPDV
jgi:hypothetical protein